MIVCSCNVFSDHQLRSTLANATRPPRMSEIYERLGSSVQCGRCAHTIRRIVKEIPTCAIGAGPANARLYAAETAIGSGSHSLGNERAGAIAAP
jgi:bacterioferritin-associated ferredoxin